MECGTSDTFDFCDRPGCRDQIIENHVDLTSPHLPTHDFVKLRMVIIQYRQIGKVLRKAKNCLEFARKRIEKTRAVGASDESHTETRLGFSKLKCISCQGAVSYPCWFCIDCPSTF